MDTKTPLFEVIGRQKIYKGCGNWWQRDSVIRYQKKEGQLSRKKVSIPEHRFHLLSLKSLSALIIPNQWISFNSWEKGFIDFKTSQKRSILHRPFQPVIKSRQFNFFAFFILSHLYPDFRWQSKTRYKQRKLIQLHSVSSYTWRFKNF